MTSGVRADVIRHVTRYRGSANLAFGTVLFKRNHRDDMDKMRKLVREEKAETIKVVGIEEWVVLIQVSDDGALVGMLPLFPRLKKNGSFSESPHFVGVMRWIGYSILFPSSMFLLYYLDGKPRFLIINNFNIYSTFTRIDQFYCKSLNRDIISDFCLHIKNHQFFDLSSFSLFDSSSTSIQVSQLGYLILLKHLHSLSLPHFFPLKLALNSLKCTFFYHSFKINFPKTPSITNFYKSNSTFINYDKYLELMEALCGEENIRVASEHLNSNLHLDIFFSNDGEVVD